MKVDGVMLVKVTTGVEAVVDAGKVVVVVVAEVEDGKVVVDVEEVVGVVDDGMVEKEVQLRVIVHYEGYPSVIVV